jgi:hypothetical protein
MLGAAILCPAGAKTITAQNRTARLGLERHCVGLATLITDDFEALAFRASTTTLFRSAKILPTGVTARLATLRMTQSPLTIIILLSFGKWKGGSTLGASDFHVCHIYLPRKKTEEGSRCAGRQCTSP